MQGERKREKEVQDHSKMSGFPSFWIVSFIKYKEHWREPSLVGKDHLFNFRHGFKVLLHHTNRYKALELREDLNWRYKFGSQLYIGGQL